MGLAMSIRPPSFDLRWESVKRRNDMMTKALWIAQALLAALFLFAGGMKLILPLDQMTGPVALPGAFLRFIGVAEVLGGLGLILPGLLRIGPGLTPLAAAGLFVIMVGATAITLAGGDVVSAVIPLVVGLVAAFVAVAGGWRRTAVRARSSAVPAAR
jgi:hypothetical protein